jgi:hypothetical protein
MKEEIVGKIEGYDVIYLPEKDILFCKNTTMPYKVMKAALLDCPVDRLELKEKLTMTVSEGIVQLACLTTNIENVKEINKNITKIKNGRRIIKTKSE